MTAGIGSSPDPEPGGRRGWQHTEEAKRKIAEARRGKKASGETREKMRASHLGQRPTKETLEKMSANQRAAQRRPEVAAKKGGPNTGRSGGRRPLKYPDPNAIREGGKGQWGVGK